MDNCVIFVVLCIVLVFSCAAPILKEKCNKFDGEYGQYFEGDIVLTKAQHEAIRGGNRNGAVDVAMHWPNNTVVYHIKNDFDKEQVQMIEYAIADLASKSCLKFKKREREDEHAVYIQGTVNGCFSNVGFNIPDDEGEVHQVLNLTKGGFKHGIIILSAQLGYNPIDDPEANQALNLGSKCFRHGTIIHEMLHNIGFFHMQNVYDRDDYVEVLWENIKEENKHNFLKYDKELVTSFGVPYDYHSVLHYCEKEFSKNEKRTIIPLKAGVQIGQRIGLSKGDIVKLNKMYNCEDTGVQEVITTECKCDLWLFGICA